MVAGNFVLAVAPRQHGSHRGRQAAGQRDLALGTGQGAEHARSSPIFIGLQGAIISAVDLVRGVGCAGRLGPHRRARRDRLSRHRLRGQGSLRRSQALEDHDIVCVHVEAPDEASHEGRAEAKVEALERIDRDIVGPLREALESFQDVADLDFARPFDAAAHPRPRPRPGGLGDGRDRIAGFGQELRRSVRPRRRRSVPRPGLPAHGTIPRPELGRPRDRAGRVRR